MRAKAWLYPQPVVYKFEVNPALRILRYIQFQKYTLPQVSEIYFILSTWLQVAPAGVCGILTESSKSTLPIPHVSALLQLQGTGVDGDSTVKG